MKKIAIFVDVQNVYYTTKEAYHCNFDYNKFWAKVAENREVVQAFAYAIEKNDEKQKQFQNILRAIGFDIRLKPFITRKDGSAKGDWDVGITLDVVEFAKEVDVVVLVTGDGDFDLLVNHVKKKYNVEVEIYGVRKLTAFSLVDSATKFIPIEGNLLLRPRK